jgi:hypothetical protein
VSAKDVISVEQNRQTISTNRPRFSGSREVGLRLSGHDCPFPEADGEGTKPAIKILRISIFSLDNGVD